MNTLHLTLKRRWFEMESCGEKKEEYREIKPYWIKRFLLDVETKKPAADWDYVIRGLINQDDTVSYSFQEYHRIVAKNGYSKTSPIIHWEHLGISIGEPNPSWCEPQDVGKKVFILKIGDILYDSNFWRRPDRIHDK